MAAAAAVAAAAMTMERRESRGARATRRTTLINIHDEIYPSIITGPEIYARSAVSDRSSTARATAPRLNPQGVLSTNIERPAFT